MGQQIGKGHVFGVPATLMFYVADGSTEVTNYVTPALSGRTMTHVFDSDETRSQAGDIDSLIVGMGEKLECEFEYVARGATIASAKISTTLPVPGAKVTMTGAPIIAVGSFTDAYNTNGTNTQPWIYLGGGTLTENAGGKLVGKIKLHRYIGITSAAPISS